MSEFIKTFGNNYSKFIFAFFVLFGIVLSYALVNIYFVIDSDVSNSPIVWHEITQHGFSIMEQWRPTPDNWYFSVYPLHFIAFKITNSTSPEILKFFEILQVFFASLVTSLISYKISNNIKSFLLIPFLCCLSSYAYTIGYISHPFSHNITNLYGLICIYLYLINSDKNSLFIEIVIGILSMMAALSDPWFLASFYIPLLMVSFYDIFITRAKKKVSIVPLIISGLLLFTHVIQNALNLPIAKFSFGTVQQMFENIYWYLLGVGGSLNIFFLQNQGCYIVSTIIFMFFCLKTITSIKHLKNYEILIFLSIIGISSSFILGSMPGAPYSGRFFVNIIYLGIMIIFTHSIQNSKKIIWILLSVTFLSGVYSHLGVKNNQHELKVNQLYEFLNKNDLMYGFGPYWGTEVLAISWMSNWNTIIKPVTFNPNTGFMTFPGRAQSFDNWYKPENNRTKQRQFVAITNDGEECRNISTCLDGVKQQYGEPAEILKFKNIYFYVYDKQIIDYSWPDTEQTGVLTADNDINTYFWPGWSGPEKGGRWTEGLNTSILISHPRKWENASFTIKCNNYQKITGSISFNGKVVSPLLLDAGQHDITFTLKNDHKNENDDRIKVDFKFDALKSPKQAGINNDTRVLGISVNNISYHFD